MKTFSIPKNENNNIKVRKSSACTYIKQNGIKSKLNSDISINRNVPNQNNLLQKNILLNEDKTKKKEANPSKKFLTSITLNAKALFTSDMNQTYNKKNNAKFLQDSKNIQNSSGKKSIEEMRRKIQNAVSLTRII